MRQNFTVYDDKKISTRKSHYSTLPRFCLCYSRIMNMRLYGKLKFLAAEESIRRNIFRGFMRCINYYGGRKSAEILFRCLCG